MASLGGNASKNMEDTIRAIHVCKRLSWSISPAVVTVYNEDGRAPSGKASATEMENIFEMDNSRNLKLNFQEISKRQYIQ